MVRPDVSFYRALADEVRLEILTVLLEGAATQKVLGQRLRLNSGTVSRRVRELEALGLVSRARSHAPYELTHRARTQDLLEAGADLSAFSLRAQADAAEEFRQHLRGAAAAADRPRDGEQETP